MLVGAITSFLLWQAHRQTNAQGAYVPATIADLGLDFDFLEFIVADASLSLSNTATTLNPASQPPSSWLRHLPIPIPPCHLPVQGPTLQLPWHYFQQPLKVMYIQSTLYFF